MLDQQLMVGSIYRIKLKGVFERHGVCTTPGLTCLHRGNGTFRLEQITSFKDLVKAGIKLYENFFEPLNISEDEYMAYFSDKPADETEKEYATQVVHTTDNVVVSTEFPSEPLRTVKRVVGKEKFVETGKSIVRRHLADSVDYADHPLYKFVDVVNPLDFIYVPELTLDGFPEIEISEYKNLHLTFHLGYFDEPKLLDPMLLAIRERMAVYGVTPSHIKLYSTGSKWLNPDEYEKIKTVRIPGEEKTIPSNATYDLYVGDHVILNGKLKAIVEKVEPGKEDEQIEFESVRTKPRVIDTSVFLTKVLANDKFNTTGGKVYYEKMVDGSGNDAGLRVLREDETPNGGTVMRFGTTPAYAGASRYSKEDAKFIMVPYGIARDFKKVYVMSNDMVGRENDDQDVSGERLVYSDNIVNPSDYFWVRHTYQEVVEGQDNPVQEQWLTATAEDVNDPETPVYYLTDAVYYTEDAAGSFYPQSNYEGDANHVGTGEYYYEDYASVQALALVNATITYTDNHGIRRQNTMSLPDVIELASNVREITIPTQETDPKFYTEYFGRRFRYTEVIGGVEETFEVVIPNVTDSKIVSKTGELVGVSGEVAHNLYFLKDTTAVRNYYVKYMLLKQEFDILQDKYNKLEQHVIAMPRNAE